MDVIKTVKNENIWISCTDIAIWLVKNNLHMTATHNLISEKLHQPNSTR
jgi:hypothetical protein